MTVSRPNGLMKGELRLISYCPESAISLFYTFVSKQTKTIITSSTLLLLTYVFFALTTIGNSNATIRRMRTAFTPTEDASFNVRKENQKKLASYMKYKPFGEGLGLSGDRAGERISKRFTTSIPTDSWYVKIWVETGAVGLTLYLSMIFLSIGWGAERATDRVTLWHIRNVYQCIRELFLGTIPDNGNFLYGTYFYNGRTLSRSRNTRKKIN